jgi:hypothetical protein
MPFVTSPEVPSTPIGYVPAPVLPIVVTVRVDVPEAPGIDAGLNWQVAPLGNPAQESVTVPVNPRVGLTFTVEVDELPDVTAAGDKGEAERAKLGAVLFKRTARPPASPGTGKRISGRPSPFMSSAISGGTMPVVFRRAGISVKEPKVPSPFPGTTPMCAR